MGSFVEQLKNYFEETPRDKVLADWAESAEFDNITPTVEGFLQNSRHHYILSNPPNDKYDGQISNNFYSPKFTSGFFLF